MGCAGASRWRRERDSNPRYSFPYTRFPGVRLRPLGHPSGAAQATRRRSGRKGPQPIAPHPGEIVFAADARLAGRAPGSLTELEIDHFFTLRPAEKTVAPSRRGADNQVGLTLMIAGSREAGQTVVRLSMKIFALGP